MPRGDTLIANASSPQYSAILKHSTSFLRISGAARRSKLIELMGTLGTVELLRFQRRFAFCPSEQLSDLTDDFPGLPLFEAEYQSGCSILVPAYAAILAWQNTGDTQNKPSDQVLITHIPIWAGKGDVAGSGMYSQGKVSLLNGFLPRGWPVFGCRFLDSFHIGGCSLSSIGHIQRTNLAV